MKLSVLWLSLNSTCCHRRRPRGPTTVLNKKTLSRLCVQTFISYKLSIFKQHNTVETSILVDSTKCLFCQKGTYRLSVENVGLEFL
jgi:hypothetical protein